MPVTHNPQSCNNFRRTRASGMCGAGPQQRRLIVESTTWKAFPQQLQWSLLLYKQHRQMPKKLLQHPCLLLYQAFQVMSSLPVLSSAVIQMTKYAARNGTQGKRKKPIWVKIKTLTTASLLVMNEANLVGTKPGATQFTRVFGAISAARAYPIYIINN